MEYKTEETFSKQICVIYYGLICFKFEIDKMRYTLSEMLFCLKRRSSNNHGNAVMNLYLLTSPNMETLRQLEPDFGR